LYDMSSYSSFKKSPAFSFSVWIPRSWLRDKLHYFRFSRDARISQFSLAYDFELIKFEARFNISNDYNYYNPRGSPYMSLAEMFNSLRHFNEDSFIRLSGEIRL
jgi:hypothetical protein